MCGQDVGGMEAAVSAVVRAGARADRAVADAFGLSAAAARRAIAAGEVSPRCRKGDWLAAGTALTWSGPAAPGAPRAEPAVAPGAPALVLLAESADIALFDKPAGVPSAPLPHGGDADHALGRAAQVRPAVAAVGSAPDHGLLHRLDTPTSGVLAFACTPRGLELGHAALRGPQATAVKVYLALLAGDVAPGAWNGAIGAPRGRGKRVLVDAAAHLVRGAPRAATTWVNPVMRVPRGTLCALRLFGGRRHQIRAHAAHAGAPVHGDALYGRAENTAATPSALLLHAYRLDVAGLSAVAPVPPRFGAEAAGGHADIDRAVRALMRATTWPVQRG